MPTFPQAFKRFTSPPFYTGGVIVNDDHSAAGIYMENRLPGPIRVMPRDLGGTSGGLLSDIQAGIFGGITIPSFSWASFPIPQGADIQWAQTSIVASNVNIFSPGNGNGAGQPIARQSNYRFMDNVNCVTMGSLLLNPFSFMISHQAFTGATDNTQHCAQSYVLRGLTGGASAFGYPLNQPGISTVAPIDDFSVAGVQSQSQQEFYLVQLGIELREVDGGSTTYAPNMPGTGATVNNADGYQSATEIVTVHLAYDLSNVNGVLNYEAWTTRVMQVGAGVTEATIDCNGAVAFVIDAVAPTLSYVPPNPYTQLNKYALYVDAVAL